MAHEEDYKDILTLAMEFMDEDEWTKKSLEGVPRPIRVAVIVAFLGMLELDGDVPFGMTVEEMLHQEWVRCDFCNENVFDSDVEITDDDRRLCLSCKNKPKLTAV